MVAGPSGSGYPGDAPEYREDSMPRGPRLDAPGMVHHVWTHAVDRRELFADTDDRRDLLLRLGAILPDEGAHCFGWALMSNHLHLVVKTGERRLGTLMQRILTGYAMRFNGRAGRRGYLVQSRFGSRPVQDEADLRIVIRYVLRNPLEAGLARSLDGLARYPWCGLGALLGRRSPLPFESVAETLDLFGPDEATARAQLRAWLGPRDEAPRPQLDRIIRDVCTEFGVLEADLRSGRRTSGASRARARVCLRAVDGAGLGVVEVARALGLSHAAVSQALARAHSLTSDGKGTSPS
jgi:REP element-mobilizing transposase RayT